MSKTIVLIHGAWVTPACWERFQHRYEQRGYRCLAPPWPHDDRPVPELRRQPAPELAGLGVADIANHYAALIRALPEPPILIGHSFGGLFVQLLLDRGLGAAGVAIDSAPPRGVLPGLATVRASAWILFTWGAWHTALRISFGHFRDAFVHQLPEAEQRDVYDRHVVPTPGRIFFQAALGIGTRINFRNGARPPLLLIAGVNDRCVEPGVNRANYARYRFSRAVTGFQAFPGRTHWLIASPGWEQVADYAIHWVEAQTAEAMTPA